MYPLNQKILDLAKSILNLPMNLRGKLEEIARTETDPEKLNFCISQLEYLQGLEGKIFESILKHNPHFFEDIQHKSNQIYFSGQRQTEEAEREQELLNLEKQINQDV